MRLILVSLLIINLAYLGYQFTQPVKIEQEKSIDVAVATGAEPIRLLSELSSKPKENKPDPSRQSPLCWAVGPYPVELDAKHLYARMLAMDIPAKVESQSVVIKEEFWVYLEPMANRKQAMRKLKELQKRKVDSFVITEGELENGISLGLFGQKESVDRLLAKLKEKNITASVKPLKRTRNQYWVMAPINTQYPMDESTRNRLMEGRDTPWLQIHCDSGLPQA